MEFSHELALSLVQSTEQFPVDFDAGWKWLGYSTKQKAKNKLTNNFEQGIDYHINQMVKRVEGNRGGGSVRFESISLSVDCFKSLAMMAGTTKGKEVRRYFLECERIAKQAVEVIPAQAQEIERLKLELQVAQAQAAAAQSQERLMQATNAIAALHGFGMVELILGKPDATVTRSEVVEKTVAVDPKTGRVLSQSDGMTIGYLTKRLGFKNNEQTWQWLNSVQLGKDSGVWSRERSPYSQASPTLIAPNPTLICLQDGQSSAFAWRRRRKIMQLTCFFFARSNFLLTMSRQYRRLTANERQYLIDNYDDDPGAIAQIAAHLQLETRACLRTYNQRRIAPIISMAR